MEAARDVNAGCGGAERRAAAESATISVMEQRISLITLGVRDVARARAFYETLGWKTGTDAGPEIAFFQVGPMVFSLWSREQLAEESSMGDGSVKLA